MTIPHVAEGTDANPASDTVRYAAAITAPGATCHRSTMRESCAPTS
jgi:hypothetical protein